MTHSERLLAVIPAAPRLLTMRRAGLDAGLHTGEARRAVLELAAAGLITATLDGHETLEPAAWTLLCLTEEGRKALDGAEAKP